MDSVFESVSFYLRYYQKSAIHAWDHMTPMQYGWILIAVAAIGFMFMRSGIKR